MLDEFLKDFIDYVFHREGSNYCPAACSSEKFGWIMPLHKLALLISGYVKNIVNEDFEIVFD